MKTIIKIIKLFILPTFEQFKKVQTPTKAEVILAHRNGQRAFIETGSEYGNMLGLIANQFDVVRTVELDPQKAEDIRKNYPTVSVYEGDSGALLPSMLVPEPSVLWLDAHAPGDFSIFKPTEYPVIRELRAVLSRKDDVILIDDARHFDILTLIVMRLMVLFSGRSLKTTNGLFIIT